MQNGAVATPQVPPDHGMASLGQLMQLVGGLLLAFMAGVTLMLVQVLPSGGPAGVRFWVFAILGVGAAAGAVQLVAGRALSSRQPGALGKVRLYAVLGWIDVVLAVWFLVENTPLPGSAAVVFGTILGVWPTFLFVVSFLPPYRELLDQGLPETPDRGAEGLSIYMSLFGAIGLCIALYAVYAMVKGELLEDWRSVVMLICVILLAVRAALQVSAGLKGALRQAWVDFQEAAERYAFVGTIVAVLVGVALAVILLSAPRQEFTAFVGIAMVVGALLVWPSVVRHSVSGWNPARSSRVGTGETAKPTVAPDRGLTSLGWLLLSSGVVGGTLVIVSLIFGTEGFGPSSIEENKREQIFGLVVTGLEVFAGLSLLRMTSAWKVATLAYAGVAAVLSVINVAENFRRFESLPFAGGDPSSLLVFTLILSLVLPIGSGLIVLRGSGRPA